MTLKDDKTPGLNGLVLAGGKSSRMGQPKDRLRWYGKEQRYHAADLLKRFCTEVFISCRQDQLEGMERGYQSLPDTFLSMGPTGGILSALRHDRSKAWLVVACDLPLLNEATIQLLVDSRDASKTATAFQNRHDNLPEPLIAIWEPGSYPVLLEYLGRGIICPRKVLINSDIIQLNAPEEEVLMNVNTPEEAGIARALLNNQ